MKRIVFCLWACVVLWGVGCGALDAVLLRPSPNIRLTPDDFGFKADALLLPLREDVQISIWHVHTPVQRKGIIVIVPGNDANKSRFTVALPIFANDGWDVILMDYLGFGQSGGTATLQGLVDSTRPVFDYAASQADVVVGFGISMGTPVLARIAADVDMTACIFESMLNIRQEASLFLDHNNLGSPIGPIADGVATLGTPDDYDIKKWITLVDEPKLFLHSPDDSVTPLQGVWEIFDLAPQPKQLLTTFGEHATAVFLDPALYRSMVNGWLDGVLADEPELDQRFSELLQNEIDAALGDLGIDIAG